MTDEQPTPQPEPLNPDQQRVVDNVAARFHLGAQLLTDARVIALMHDPIFTIGFKQTIRRYVADKTTQGSRALIATLAAYTLASLDTYANDDAAAAILTAAFGDDIFEDDDDDLFGSGQEKG